jgi:hypothetical protein
LPVHIGELTSDVTVLEGELPLSQQQIDKLVQLVLQRLEEKQREARLSREATMLRRQALPPLQIGE